MMFGGLCIPTEELVDNIGTTLSSSVLRRYQCAAQLDNSLDYK